MKKVLKNWRWNKTSRK